ncbi:MAG: hypothetical protein MRY21_04695 [Simkaniaceae bacterium]|nr:hypothetical protein [Simkaniaceae bacterium]
MEITTRDAFTRLAKIIPENMSVNFADGEKFSWFVLDASSSTPEDIRRVEEATHSLFSQKFAFVYGPGFSFAARLRQLTSLAHDETSFGRSRVFNLLGENPLPFCFFSAENFFSLSQDVTYLRFFPEDLKECGCTMLGPSSSFDRMKSSRDKDFEARMHAELPKQEILKFIEFGCGAMAQLIVFLAKIANRYTKIEVTCIDLKDQKNRVQKVNRWFREMGLTHISLEYVSAVGELGAHSDFDLVRARDVNINDQVHYALSQLAKRLTPQGKIYHSYVMADEVMGPDGKREVLETYASHDRALYRLIKGLDLPATSTMCIVSDLPRRIFSYLPETVHSLVLHVLGDTREIEKEVELYQQYVPSKIDVKFVSFPIEKGVPMGGDLIIKEHESLKNFKDFTGEYCRAITHSVGIVKEGEGRWRIHYAKNGVYSKTYTD